jgi:hypothetical protein
MRSLEKFLDALASNSLIKNSQIFLDFLSIEKESDFNSKKKGYAKLKSPSKLNEIKSIDGTVNKFVNNNQ